MTLALLDTCWNYVSFLIHLFILTNHSETLLPSLVKDQRILVFKLQLAPHRLNTYDLSGYHFPNCSHF